MDRRGEYREIIKRLLRERERFARASLPEGLEVACLFDDTTEQYALLSLGWMQGKRVSGATLLLRVKDDKIWIEDDGTDAPIAEDLIAAGVPKQDIVLAFHSPELRRHTEFAIA
jgi:hypothetical protein